jgi:hypothetical protein
MAETDQTDNNAAQPGQVIAPGGAPSPTPTTTVVETAPPPAATAPPATNPPLIDDTATPVPQMTSSSSSDDITWTASEFVAHQKSAGWYGGLVAVAVVLTALIYLLTQSLISVAVIIVCAIVFGFYAGHQPRQLEYKLDSTGLNIGGKRYEYQSFRSFSVVSEAAFSNIIFMPLQRFAPLISIYYAPEHEEQIIDLLSDRLPFEEYRHDMVDRLMNRIRF